MIERVTKRLVNKISEVVVYIGQHKLYDTGDIPAEMQTAGVRECLQRLAAYEETGLEPEEIAAAQKAMRAALGLACELQAFRNLGTFDHLRELVQAEKAGRLVELPCKVGDTVYVIGEGRVVECCIDEVYLDDTKGVEYLVSFDCDSDCDGCPFSDWHQDFSGEYSCSGECEEVSIRGSDFGKTVFLSRKAAEAALKGGNENAMQDDL